MTWDKRWNVGVKLMSTNGLKHFQQYQWGYGCFMLCTFMMVNAIVLSTSTIMEASRNGKQPSFQLWEPFVWEFSSAIGVLVLVPAVVWLLRIHPFARRSVGRSIAVYFFAAMVFSVVHILLMTAVRQMAYAVSGISYFFGSLAYEFIYELRKDVQTFLLIILVSKAYRFISSRVIGEASMIEERGRVDESETKVKCIDRLLVKKLGKEFIVRLEDVEWMESSGNYVNLHMNGRIYPIRRTLGALSEDVAEKGFCRVHRSHAINLDVVESMSSLPSGDGEVTLKSGKVLKISRRYKDSLKQRLL